MLVPLLLNRRPEGEPRRTVDVMPSTLAALGISLPKTLDGVSFF
jgi:arylsulfatase A-like enzyme